MVNELLEIAGKTRLPSLEMGVRLLESHSFKFLLGKKPALAQCRYGSNVEK
jgi:hypothetical protein